MKPVRISNPLENLFIPGMPFNHRSRNDASPALVSPNFSFKPQIVMT